MKRYDPYTGVMDEDPEGDFVSYSDACAELDRQGEQFMNRIRVGNKEIERLEAEVKRLREWIAKQPCTCRETGCDLMHCHSPHIDCRDCADYKIKILQPDPCEPCRARRALKEEG